MTARLPRTTLAVTAVAAALALTGCASKSTTAPTGSGASSGASAKAGSLFSTLPPDIQKSKTLRAATDGTYPPNEFTGPDGKTLQGFDIDLAKAVGDKLGVTIHFDNAKFDSIITGISANRYDLAFSSFTDNKARQAKVDFVDYFTAGTSILVKKGNPEKISKLEDLCGKKVALESGTTQVKIAQGAKCTGGQKVMITQLPDDATARLQVTTGRAVADMNDFPVAAYTAKTSNGGKDFEVVGTQYESAPYGAAISKQLPQVRDAVKTALEQLIADGTYDTILKKYDIEQGALKTPTINAGS
jgi:polar amino acid transport system substrate-binding protein